MYDEIVKQLRDNAEFLVKASSGYLSNSFADTMGQAADAIEEMQKCLDGVEADNDSLCATIEELERGLKRSKEYEAFWEKEANEALKKFQMAIASNQKGRMSMGVYLPNMDMPKCCAECDAEGHYENSYGDEYGFFCPFGYKAYTEETRDAKRLDNCPLVPVPPHGDLIGRDTLRAEVKKHATPSDAWVFSLIRTAPTVLEAEEGET